MAHRWRLALFALILAAVCMTSGCVVKTYYQALVNAGHPHAVKGSVKLTVVSSEMKGRDLTVRLLVENRTAFYSSGPGMYLGDFSLESAGNNVPIQFSTYTLGSASDAMKPISPGQTLQVTVTFQNVVGKPGVLVYSSYASDGEMKVKLRNP